MSTALRLILGLSILATAVGCDNGGNGDDGGDDGPNAVTSGTSSGGNASSAGSGNNTTGGKDVIPSAGSDTAGGNTTVLPEGVPLTPADGWVAVDSNTLGVQGAMFAYADTTSLTGLVEDFVGANACIKGTAAKVDMKCTPVAPAVDCYGTFWGAAIGLNLNQPIDEATGEGVVTPMPFDGSTLTGFAFEITGAMVPTSLRFKVEDSTGEFCNLGTKTVKLGANEFKFSELSTECWKPVATSRKGDAAKAGMLKIAWQVVTNDKSTVPFDYCVANVRALQ